MSRNCLECRYCFNGEVCTLFEELVEENGSCFMWKAEKRGES